MTEVPPRPPSGFDQYGNLSGSVDGDYSFTIGDPFALCSLGSNAFVSQEQYHSNAALRSDTEMPSEEMDHLPSHQYLNNFSVSSVDPAPGGHSLSHLGTSHDYGQPETRGYRGMDSPLGLSSSVPKEWTNMPVIAQQHTSSSDRRSNERTNYWNVQHDIDLVGNTADSDERLEENYELPTSTLLALSVAVMRLDKARRSIRTDTAPPTLETGSHGMFEAFNEPMRKILNFCNTMVPVLASISIRRGSQQNRVANSPWHMQISHLATVSILACSAAIDIQAALLARLDPAEAVIDQSGPSKAMQTHPSPALSRNSSQARSLSVSGVASMHSAALDEPQYCSNNDSPISMTARAQSMLTLGSPDGKVQDAFKSHPQQQPHERKSTFNSSLAQLLQLDTMEFHLTHLLAICKRLQETLDQLAPEVISFHGHIDHSFPATEGIEDGNNDGNPSREGTTAASYAFTELVKENEAMTDRIENFQREVVDRARRLKNRELA